MERAHFSHNHTAERSCWVTSMLRLKVWLTWHLMLIIRQRWPLLLQGENVGYRIPMWEHNSGRKLISNESISLAPFSQRFQYCESKWWWVRTGPYDTLLTNFDRSISINVSSQGHRSLWWFVVSVRLTKWPISHTHTGFAGIALLTNQIQDDTATSVSKNPYLQRYLFLFSTFPDFTAESFCLAVHTLLP